MLDYETRERQASNIYNIGIAKVTNNQEPKQKFPCGSRVHIAKDLGKSMSHFCSDRDATVLHTCDEDIESYCLDIDGIGEVCWYEEEQLTLIQDD